MLLSKRSLVLPLLGLAVACGDEPTVEGMASPAMGESSGTMGEPDPGPSDDDDDDDDDDGTTGGSGTTGAPSSDDGTTTGDLETTGFETTGGSSSDTGVEEAGSEESSTAGGFETTGSSTGETGDTDGTTGGTTGDTDGTTGDTDGTTGDTDGTTGEADPFAGFESPQPFGDSVVELDLIGTWHLPTDGAAGSYAMALEIDEKGNFRWTEYDDTCGVVREGSGVLWVNGGSLSMLFETFTGIAPWDTFTQFGFDSTAPFLLRSGYAPVLGHVAVTAPAGMRIAEPWNSLGFSRTVGGSTAEDVWVSETELWDIRPGDETATIIGRDRHTLDISNGEAWHTINHWWFEDGMQLAGDPTEYYLYPYTDDLVGNLTLAGEHFVYVGSAMASFEPGDNFQLDAPSVCE